MIVCHTSGSGLPGSSRRLRGTTDTRLADVTESPLANKVTSWPISTSASVRYETTRSVPPYARGGTLSYNGATWAILTVRSFWWGDAAGPATPERNCCDSTLPKVARRAAPHL